jgi:hypothetical protein
MDNANYNTQLRQLKQYRICRSLVLLPLFTGSAIGLLASFSPTALGQPVAQPSPAAETSPNPDLNRISEQFVDLIAAGEYEQARRMLNPVLREGWTAAQMRRNWESLQKIVGPYKGRSNTQVVDGNLVLVDLEFEQATDNLLIIFDEQQQIQGVDFPLQVPRV